MNIDCQLLEQQLKTLIELQQLNSNYWEELEGLINLVGIILDNNPEETSCTHGTTN